jgi:hypothetical protein
MEHAKCVIASATLTEVIKKKYSKLSEVIGYYICSIIA